MRQLWCHLHAAVAPRRHRALPVQRVRAVPQNERHEPAFGQARQEIGRFRNGECTATIARVLLLLLFLHTARVPRRCV